MGDFKYFDTHSLNNLAIATRTDTNGSDPGGHGCDEIATSDSDWRGCDWK